MSATTEQALYEILLRDKFTAPLERLEAKMNKFESKVNGLNAGSLLQFAKGMGLAFGATEIVQGIGVMTTKMVTLGATMEQTRIAFKTLLGDAEYARQAIGVMQDFAEATPFTQSEVVAGAKSLLAYQFSMKDVTRQMTMLGDVSAGLGVPLNDLVYLYGTLHTQGKVMTKDIMQFAGRGVPIIEYLAEVLKKPAESIDDMVTEGKVGFKDIEDAFALMTAKGSMFGGMMDAQSKSLLGRWSTFQDRIDRMMTSLGEKMLPTLGAVLDGMSDIVSEIPNLNFDAITYSFEQLWDIGSDVVQVFGDIFRMTGLNMEGFNGLQGAVQHIGFALRVATTPLRIFASVMKIIGTTIQSVAPLIVSVGTAMGNLATGKFDQLGKNWTDIKSNSANFSKTMASTISEMMHDEGQGWEKVFKAGKGSEKETFSLDGFNDKKKVSKFGGADGDEDKKKKGIGVEKVQSGTRNVVVNITTLKLADSIISNKADLSDARLMEQLRRAMLTAVNDVNMVQN